MLTRQGYRVTRAESGELALAAAAANLPDVILLDGDLDGPGGLEVCRRLKAHEATRHIPVILMRSPVAADDWAEGLEAGLADHVGRPPEVGELVTRIGTHLALRRAQTSLVEHEAALGRCLERLDSEVLAHRKVAADLKRSAARADRSRKATLGALEDEILARAKSRRQAAVTEAVNRLLKASLLRGPAGAVARVCLSEAKRLTGSPSGWVGEVTPEGGFDFTSLTGPDRAAGGDPGCSDAAFGRLERDGLFRGVLETGEPLLLNRPRPDPGVPGPAGGNGAPGALLGVALREDGRTVGMIVLADTPAGYSPDDLSAVEALSGALSLALRRMRAEEALRLRDSALEAAANAIVITDAEGRIEWSNASFARQSGYTEDEVLGKNPRLLKSGIQDEAFYRELWATITSGEVWRGEIVNRRRDGGFYPEEMTITPVRDPEGAIRHFVAVKQDIAERKKAETALEQSRAQLVEAQKLEAVGRLAGGVAHDFNNILQVLLSQVETLRISPGPDGQPDGLEEMEANVRRGARLTSQLLLFARRQVPEKQRVNLGEVVGETAGLLRRLLPANVKLGLEIAPGPLWVEADTGQLQQVMMNLAVNAGDAMKSGGILTVRTSGGGGEAVLEVEDTGEGMDEYTRAHLFEPFFTTKGPGQGTGLGLAVVHGIVTQHGGSIEVSRSPGEGTLFRVRLPAVPAPQATGIVPGGEADLPRGQGERLLLVEDEEGARHGFVKMLGLLGYHVTAVGSGEEVDALPDDPPPDLLLSDFMLPGISGLELVDRVRRRWPATKVVLMSGYSDGEARTQCVDDGIACFLQKPFGMASLARAVRGGLDSPGRG